MKTESPRRTNELTSEYLIGPYEKISDISYQLPLS